MQLLQEVDKPGSDIEEYAASLDLLLAQKMEIAAALRARVAEFQSHIKQEKDLSKQLFEQQKEIQDVFDLRSNTEEDAKDDLQMLTNNLDTPMIS